MNEDEINEYNARYKPQGKVDPIAHKLNRDETHKYSAKFKRNHPEVQWKSKVREEEYDMNEDEEYMEPQVSELVSHSIDQRPLDFQQSFADLMQQRIEDAVHEKKLEIAAGFVTGANTDPSDDDYGDFEDDDSNVDDDSDYSDESDVESEEEDENA